MLLTGRIIEERKNYYSVDTHKGIIRSFLKGTLKKECGRLYVGDMVTVEFYNSDDPEGVIRQLHPRATVLKKPAVANIDLILCTVTLIEPPVDFEFIDRFLFTAGSREFPVILVFNKCDLLSSAQRGECARLMEYYGQITRGCIATSALTGENVDFLTAQCKNLVSIFAGPSGTGKSALLSRIFPSHPFRVAAVSRQTRRGVHTTTHTTLCRLPGGGYCADTPGFSYLDVPAISETDVAPSFPEIAGAAGRCKYADCVHANEPGCVVKELVASGAILRTRYESYLKLYREILDKNRDYTRRTERHAPAGSKEH